MDVYGLRKNLCQKDNRIVFPNHICIYHNSNVECSKCHIVGLNNRNGGNVRGLIEKVKNIT